jgi:hypothetical protein
MEVSFNSDESMLAYLIQVKESNFVLTGNRILIFWSYRPLIYVGLLTLHEIAIQKA